MRGHYTQNSQFTAMGFLLLTSQQSLFCELPTVLPNLLVLNYNSLLFGKKSPLLPVKSVAVLFLRLTVFGDQKWDPQKLQGWAVSRCWDRVSRDPESVGLAGFWPCLWGVSFLLDFEFCAFYAWPFQALNLGPVLRSCPFWEYLFGLWSDSIFRNRLFCWNCDSLQSDCFGTRLFLLKLCCWGTFLLALEKQKTPKKWDSSHTNGLLLRPWPGFSA